MRTGLVQHMHKHNHTHKTCCCKKRHVNRRSELLPAAFPSWLGRAGTKDKPVVHLFFKSRNDTPARQISSRSRWSTSHLAVPSGDLSRLRYCLLAERWRVGGEEFEGVGGEERCGAVLADDAAHHHCSILLRIGECGCSLSVCLSFPRQGQPKNPTTEEKQTKSESCLEKETPKPPDCFLVVGRSNAEIWGILGGQWHNVSRASDAGTDSCQHTRKPFRRAARGRNRLQHVGISACERDRQ
ncbi:hypothetical protein JOL62DRAFT_244204 [Phyllosticta paracitricarpa]|uniref:Uncharacterized protein n=2 Tax=Phyllosticta TaxID=121621 RepID=A0ABR1MPW2_9PEZI